MMNTTLISFFNFSILVVLLVIKLKQPIRDFLKQRHDAIRDEIKSVHEQLLRAQQMYEEFSAKLKSVDQEIRGLREQSKLDMVAMKNRVLAEAERLSKEVISDAKAASASLYTELRNELFSEVSYQVLDRAEGLLRDRLTGEDHVRIQNEFSKQLEAIR